ncbi:hypothetical protein D3C71_1757600 [compost metagenome]
MAGGGFVGLEHAHVGVRQGNTGGEGHLFDIAVQNGAVPGVICQMRKAIINTVALAKANKILNAEQAFG